jgi:hypothetical protein
VFERNGLPGQASEQSERAETLRQEARALEAAGPGSEHRSSCGKLLGAEALARSLEGLQRRARVLDDAAAAFDEAAAAIEVPAFDGTKLRPAGKELRETALIQAELGEARQAAAVFAQFDARMLERKALEEQRARYLVELAGLQAANVKLRRRLSELELPDVAAPEHNLTVAAGVISRSRGLLTPCASSSPSPSASSSDWPASPSSASSASRRSSRREAQLDIVTVCERLRPRWHPDDDRRERAILRSSSRRTES